MNIEEKVRTVQSSSNQPHSQPQSAHYGTLSVFELAALPSEWPEQLTKEQLIFRQIHSEEASAIQSAMEKAGIYEPHDAARRLVAGREAYIGELPGGIIVTYGWVALSAEPLGTTGCAFEPPPSNAYLYDFATVPEYRGRGYYPALLRFILSDLATQHLERAWIGTEPGNLTSARSILRAGFTKIADTAYVPPKEDQPARFELLGVPTASPELVRIAQAAHIGC